jgi:hypothetical protein
MDSPDWRITQKWISVEVAWHAEFEEKFRIVLKKESPVVLVLSQLDDRYFDGLQGQYSFRLQFRLHEVDSPREEDYIVRSHGNYLMERSVVTELKSLRAGTYSVFIQVVADRDTNAVSVEDVVKSQCRRKVDNDKLAQVGAMYDVAHSKAAVHMESKVAARKAYDKASARESRIAARRKNWERRHLSREIVRKQDKKNREKRARKEAKDVAEGKEKEEKEPKDKAVQTEDVKEVQIVKEDKAIQTEDVQKLEPGESADPEVPPTNDTDKGVQTMITWTRSSSSQSTPETPKSNATIVNSPPPQLMRLANHGGPPPPPVYVRDRKNSNTHRYSRPPPPRPQYITSDGESSASPISDFDDLYSDDDHTLKPRPLNTDGSSKIPDSSKRGKDSDDDDEPEPWNAVCIVGFRVYSKDEGLEVKIFDESLEAAENVLEKDDEEGTDGDVEDGGDDNKKGGITPNKANDAGSAEKKTDDKIAAEEEPTLPIRVKENEELILVDGEKKAFALGTEASTLSTDGGASLVDETKSPKETALEEGKKTESTPAMV